MHLLMGEAKPEPRIDNNIVSPRHENKMAEITEPNQLAAQMAVKLTDQFCRLIPINCITGIVDPGMAAALRFVEQIGNHETDQLAVPKSGDAQIRCFFE